MVPIQLKTNLIMFTRRWDGEYKRIIKHKDIANFGKHAQLGKDWEAEWDTIRDFKTPLYQKLQFWRNLYIGAK